MFRLILILTAIVVMGLVIRNALINALKENTKPGPKRRSNPNLPPDRMVCGICGEAFDPEASGWICPKCKK